MHPSPVHHLPAMLAAGSGATFATTSTTVGYIGWVMMASLVELVAVIRVTQQPAENWSHRNWSKLAWVLAILYLAPTLAGYPIPVGAIAAIWRTRRRPTGPPATGQAPIAEGSPDWPGPWEPN
jgi:hypothetical protein